MPSIIAAPNLLLPWTSTVEDDNRYRKIFFILLIPFIALSVAIPLINVPPPEREELEKLPPQLARVVLEKKEIPPPPPPPKPKEEEKKKEEPKKEEKKKEEPKKEEPPPEPEPAKLIEEAKEVAEAEINQFADALMDMRESFDLSEVNADDLTQSTGEAAELDRAIIASQANAGSGGINTNKLSRNTGGVALSGKKSTRVKSKLASPSGTKNVTKAGQKRDRSYRSDEDIRKIMDRNKGSIFAIYNRALRKDPTLEGKVVFKLVIEANGRVSAASIVSSELENPSLERKLLAKIRSINFGARDALQTTLNYSFDFLPF